MGKKILNITLKFSLFVFLTILTQIGGLVYLLSLFISKKWKKSFRAKTFLIFILLYFFITFLVVPVIANKFGRVRVEYATPSNYMTVILNRNYVKPELNNSLRIFSYLLSKDNVKITHLDANFPFIDGFPLLPHLSHNDGKKIDLSLIYENSDGVISPSQKSISGYGVFEEPKEDEYDQIIECKNAGYFQYDYPKYLTFGKINDDLIFSVSGTKLLIETLLKSDGLEKIFIEPHLKTRMDLTSNRIRFQGCGAVRHDDHIHIQIK